MSIGENILQAMRACKEIRVLQLMRLRQEGLQEQQQKIFEVFDNLFSVKEDISLVLLQMQEVGLLEALLPELTELQDYFPGAFHRFSLMAHTLYLLHTSESLDTLTEQLKAKEALPKHLHPLFEAVGVLFSGVQSQENSSPRAALRLSMLSHDAVKETDDDQFTRLHPIQAAHVLVPQVMANLPGMRENMSLVEWLVFYHQELTAIAKGTDPSKTEQGFHYHDLLHLLTMGGDMLKSANSMKLLLLLTFADAWSVDPTNGVKGIEYVNFQTTYKLYLQIQNYLLSSNKEALLAQWKQKAQEERVQAVSRLRRGLVGEAEGVSVGLTQREGDIQSVINNALKLSSQHPVRQWLDVPENFNRIWEEYTRPLSTHYLRGLDRSKAAMHVVMMALAANSWGMGQTSSEPTRQKVFHSYVSSVRTGFGNMLEFWSALNVNEEGAKYKILGVLSGLGINVNGSVFRQTSTGGLVCRVSGFFMDDQKPERIWKQIESVFARKGIAVELSLDTKSMTWEEFLPMVVQWVIENQLTIEDILSLPSTQSQSRKLQSSDHQPTTVRFLSDEENPVDGRRSLLGVEASDRMLFAYKLTRRLSQFHNVKILELRFDTYEHGARNQLYVVNRDGTVLTAEQKHRIEEDLTAFFSWDTIVNEEVRWTQRPASELTSYAQVIDNLGLPFSKEQRKIAIELIQRTSSREDLIKAGIVVRAGSDRFTTIRFLSLSRFVQRVKQQRLDSLDSAGQGEGVAWLGLLKGIKEREMGFVFPDMGQVPAQLRKEAGKLIEEYPTVRELYEQAVKHLNDPKYTVDSLLLNRSDEGGDFWALRRFLYQYALIKAWEANTGEAFHPDFLYGASIGVCTSLVVAGAVKFEDMLDYIVKSMKLIDDNREGMKGSYGIFYVTSAPGVDLEGLLEKAGVLIPGQVEALAVRPGVLSLAVATGDVGRSGAINYLNKIIGPKIEAAIGSQGQLDENFLYPAPVGVHHNFWPASVKEGVAGLVRGMQITSSEILVIDPVSPNNFIEGEEGVRRVLEKHLFTSVNLSGALRTMATIPRVVAFMGEENGPADAMLKTFNSDALGVGISNGSQVVEAVRNIDKDVAMIVKVSLADQGQDKLNVLIGELNTIVEGLPRGDLRSFLGDTVYNLGVVREDVRETKLNTALNGYDAEIRTLRNPASVEVTIKEADQVTIETCISLLDKGRGKIFNVTDAAMTGRFDPTQQKEGGINFNANQMNLLIQNSGQEIKFNVDPAMLAKLQNAPGFVPVIMSIQPMNNLPEFLGILVETR